MTQTEGLPSPHGIPLIDHSEFEDISRAMIANTAASAPPPSVQNARGSNAHDSVSSGEIAIDVIIGRASEFFDFFVYAIASVVVFPKLVFPRPVLRFGCFQLFAHQRLYGIRADLEFAWLFGAGFAPLVALILVLASQFRPAIGRRLPALRRGLHSLGVGHESQARPR